MGPVTPPDTDHSVLSVQQESQKPLHGGRGFGRDAHPLCRYVACQPCGCGQGNWNKVRPLPWPCWPRRGEGSMNDLAGICVTVPLWPQPSRRGPWCKESLWKGDRDDPYHYAEDVIDEIRKCFPVLSEKSRINHQLVIFMEPLLCQD